MTVRRIARRLATAVAAILLAAASVEGAQAQPAALAIDDPEANVVEALVVNARLPGPAWWKVSDGDTTVYVLGVVDSLPKGMAWDASVLERRLDGAFTVILPASAHAGLTDIPALLKLRKRMKAERPLDEVAPQLGPRLDKAWRSVGLKDGEWREWKPLGAGVLLSLAAFRKSGLDSAEPEKTVKRLAGRHRVKARPAVSLKAMALLKSLARDQTDASGQICLEGMIAEVEAGPGAARRAAEAWARGDVRGALQKPRESDRCSLALPGVAEAKRQLIAAQADAVAQALQRPGKAIAVFPLRGLLAEGGVLAQLKARGFVVATPDGAP